MQACSYYDVTLRGSAKNLEAAASVLNAAFSNEHPIQKPTPEGQLNFLVDDSYEVVWVFDIARLATKMVQAAPGLRELTLSGTVDSSGECMDFLIHYDGSRLLIRSSTWYYCMEPERWLDDYESREESYAEFHKRFPKYTPEQFQSFLQDTHYLLENNDIVPEVPLGAPVELDLGAQYVAISEDTLNVYVSGDSPVVVTRCTCGQDLLLDAKGPDILMLALGGYPTACPHCGKHYLIYSE